MKEFIVSLDIIMSKILLRKIINNLGVDTSNFTTKELDDQVLLRLESNLGDNATLLEQLNSILNTVPITFFNDQTKLLENAYINVGVFYDTMTCTVEIPYECIRILKELNIGMKLICYPSEK